jgi:hypothetical protein
MFENSLGVRTLFPRLFDEVSAEAFEVSNVAPHGQREIRMRGGEFQIELARELLADFWGHLGFRHNDLHYNPLNRARQQKIGLLTDDWNGPRSANQERMLS